MDMIIVFVVCNANFMWSMLAVMSLKNEPQWLSTLRMCIACFCLGYFFKAIIGK